MLSTLLKRIFPAGVISGRDGREVNGLPRGTEPQNCVVLAKAMQRHSAGDRREHYLVRCDDTLLHFRICTAMDGSGYDEFVVVQDVEGPGMPSGHGMGLERWARHRLDLMRADGH